MGIPKSDTKQSDFLPGTLEEKVDPYLRPLFDALHDMMDPEKLQRLVADDVIEVAPLAFLRGRTLNESFIVLDEAQNTTPAQMKMFLTRMGYGAKLVITGDPTQTDLPKGEKSGLSEAVALLSRLEGVGHVLFRAGDVVRHDLVRRIVAAYEGAKGKRRSSGS